MTIQMNSNTSWLWFVPWMELILLLVFICLPLCVQNSETIAGRVLSWYCYVVAVTIWYRFGGSET